MIKYESKASGWRRVGKVGPRTAIPPHVFWYSLIFGTMSIYYYDLNIFNYQKKYKEFVFIPQSEFCMSG